MSLPKNFAHSLLAALAMGLGCWPVAVFAQSFPSKPVTIVVPYPPGGTTDVLARVLQEPCESCWARPW